VRHDRTLRLRDHVDHRQRQRGERPADRGGRRHRRSTVRADPRGVRHPRRRRRAGHPRPDARPAVRRGQPPGRLRQRVPHRAGDRGHPRRPLQR
jgi:hypothetical protein